MKLLASFDEFDSSLKKDCLMLKANMPDWQSYSSAIDTKDFCFTTDKQIEDDPHITLLYGIEPTDYNRSKVLNWLDGIKPIEVNLTGISTFFNEDYDVLKIDVDSIELKLLRTDLMRIADNKQTFDEYKPHITIAFLKKGEGYKYSKLFPETRKLLLSEARYSRNDGSVVARYL